MEAKKIAPTEPTDFDRMFDSVVKDLLAMPQLSALPETNDWLEQALRYNVEGSKLNCYSIIVSIYHSLIKQDSTREDPGDAHLLGCHSEIMQAAFLVVDDMMDSSITRRGRPCWYLLESIGNDAFNDALLMLQLVFKAIKLKFRTKPYYGQWIKTLHKLNLLICLGQSMDMHEGTGRDLTTYTPALHSAITLYKDAYPFVYGPLALALATAGIDHSQLQAEALPVMRDIGELFAVHNDFCDVFGDNQNDGKVGNDIVQGKCTWLVVTALEKATSSEKQIIKDNYGKGSLRNVEACKQLFVKLRIPELYHSHVQIVHDRIQSRIDTMPPPLKAIFLYMLKHCKRVGKDFSIV